MVGRASERAVRPALRAGLACLWRDESTVQLGVDPQRAVVLGGLDPARTRLLDALNGTRDRASLVRLASSWGLGAGDVDELLSLLGEHDLLETGPLIGDGRALSYDERARLAPDLASLSLVRGGGPGSALQRRRGAWVDVRGGGRVGAGVASLLGAAGVGRVTVTDHALVTEADLSPLGASVGQIGERRGAAAMSRLATIAPSTVTTPGITAPDVTVLAPDHGPDATLSAEWLRERGPHLLAYVRETTGVVGPFVLPGRSACLRCVELHRTDRDSAWPRLALQLARPGLAVRACDVSLATHVAAQAALHVLAYLEGDEPPSVDASIESALPDALPRRRRWQLHPTCACHWPDALHRAPASDRR